MQAARSAWGVAIGGGRCCGIIGRALGRATTTQPASTSSLTQLLAPPPASRTPRIQVRCRSYHSAHRSSRGPPRKSFKYKDGIHDSCEVVLYNLPPTATHNDIRSICYDAAPSPESIPTAAPEEGEAIVESPKRNLEELLKERDGVLNDIKHLRLLRSPYLAANGRALVTFGSHQKAKAFQLMVHRKNLAGRTITAQMGRPPSNGDAHHGGPQPSRSVMLLEEMQYASPARVVLLKGLPLEGLSVKRLENMLSRTYNLATDRIPMPPTGEVCRRRPIARTDTRPHPQDLGAIVQLEDLTPLQSTTSFLVRVQTVADAMRLVRRWHRMPWQSESPMSREQKEEQQREKRNEQTRALMRGEEKWNEEEGDEMAMRYEPESGDADEQGLSDEAGKEELRPFAAKRFTLIIDAYIMY